MSLPTQRLTITPTEYLLLKPGLDVLANGLASAKLGDFPRRHPYHRIDFAASGIYRDQAYDDEMANRIICVREKLWDLSQSRKIRLDVFELAAAAFALRIRSPNSLGTIPSSLDDLKRLKKKIETYRKRAKRATVTNSGKPAYQTESERWKQFVAWSRYNILCFKLPKLRQFSRASLWRGQREQITKAFNEVLTQRLYEPLSTEQMARIATLATTSLRRSRHPVGLSELLSAPQAHADLLFNFVQKRVELVRLPGAPVPLWQAISDRGDRFNEYQERNRGKSAKPSNTSPDKIIAEEQNHQVTTPPKVKMPRRYTHKRQALTPEILVNAMAEWLYQNVTMKFDFTTEVCEQARFQITRGLLDPYRVKTAATSFNSLMKELRPVEFSDDSGILIGEIAGWLLRCLLATGQEPEWMYGAFGVAGSRAKRMEKEARYDKWIATLPNGSQIAAVRA